MSGSTRALVDSSQPVGDKEPRATRADLVEMLRELSLLDRRQLEEMDQDFLPGSEDSESLAHTLVQKGWLTSYQVEQTLLGHGADLTLGPYRLLEPLGEGGMGQVFKALHQRLERLVALKVIRKDRLSQDPEAIRRFQREAQAVAKLSHPNVVLVYDADQVGDTHFIAMEYVAGTDLSKLVQEVGPLPEAQARDYVRQTALGLQHAHEHGLVHRDIKPSNLLVSRARAGDSASAASANLSTPWGIVKILDMGLVRLRHSPEGNRTNISLTHIGMVMGTPDYIAPEQARNPRGVDIRADLYSLGCTFYYLLTGRPPFADGDVVEKLLMHQLDEPPDAATLRPDLSADVCKVLRRMMAKRPDDRPQTPREAADDLAALVPSKSAPASLLAPALRPKSHSETAVVPVTPVPLVKEHAVTLNMNGPEPAKQIDLLKGHRGWVMATAFSLDRNRLASAGMDGQVRLWGFSSHVPREQLLPGAHRDEVHALAFAPDNRTLASGSGALDGLVGLWDLAGPEPMRRATLAGHQAPVEALAFSADGKLLASASCDKTLHLWDLAGEEPRERAVLKGHAAQVEGVAIAPDGKVVASCSQDGVVCLWNIGRLWSTVQSVLEGHEDAVRTLAFSPDGRTLASGGLDRTIRLWDLEGGPETRETIVLLGHADVVRLVLFPPDGKTLVSVGDRGHIILWDLATRARLREWPMRGLMVSSVALTFDGRYLAVGKTDGTVAVFRLYPKK